MPDSNKATDHEELVSEIAEVGFYTFRSRMSLMEFNQVADQFRDDLASLLNTEPSLIEIVRIRLGCVLVDTRIPAEVAALLRQILESDDASSAVNQLKEKYRFDRIYDSENLETPYFRKRDDSEIEPSLTWLHLSDLHMRVAGGAAKFEQDQVTANLLQRLPGLLEREDINPDFVFFTGDVAQSGEKEEYDAAATFFSALLEQFEKSPRLFVVPGNHDTSWSKIDMDFESDVRSDLVDNDAVSQFLLDDWRVEARETVFRRLDNYKQFEQHALDAIGGRHDLGYFYYDKVDIAGVRVGVAALNSAWFSTNARFAPKNSFTSHPDLQHLHIGEHQLSVASSALDDCAIRFALVHHPPLSDWYSDHDRRMQEVYWPRFDFVLRGHLHRASYLGISELHGDEGWFHVATGAISTGQQKFPKSFTATRIDLMQGKGEVLLWSYHDRSVGWARDFWRNARIRTQFSLPQSLRDRLRNSSLSPR